MTGLVNPLQLFIIPFVFLFALPLAVFAGVTTVLAFLVLYFRLTVAYFDVGLDTLRFLVLGNSAGAYNSNNRRLVVVGESLGAATATATAHSSSSAAGSALSSLRASRASSPSEGKKRRGSVIVRQRRGSLTPGSSAVAPSTAGFDRDFEGIGGWRIGGLRGGADRGRDGVGGGGGSNYNNNDGGDEDDDDDDDQQWYNLNSRLELPDTRHHFRSRSGGAASALPHYANPNPKIRNGGGGARTGSVSPAGLRMTPNVHAGFSKLDGSDGYFPLQEKKHMKKLSA